MKNVKAFARIPYGLLIHVLQQQQILKVIILQPFDSHCLSCQCKAVQITSST
jgi:hypothetical protein